MDRTLVVSFDIEAGKEIVQALDETGLRPRVALWAILANYGDSRLFLASDKFDDDSLKIVDEKVFDALTEAGLTYNDTEAVQTFRMTDAFIRDLRDRYAGQGASTTRRIAGQTFGGKHIEEAYVYRIE